MATENQRRWPSQSEMEVLTLVMEHMDGATLAKSSAVCKNWRGIAAQDYLWRNLCFSLWPSLSFSFKCKSYRHFYAVRQNARLRCTQQKRQNSKRNVPWLSLSHLVLVVDIATVSSSASQWTFSLVRRGREMAECAQGMFQLQTEMSAKEARSLGAVKKLQGATEWRVGVSLMMEEAQRVVQLMESSKKGEIVGNSCVFWEPLPMFHDGNSACCCLSRASSAGHLVEVCLKFQKEEERGETSMKVREVCVGLLNTECWRYFCRDEGLLYVQYGLFW